MKDAFARRKFQIFCLLREETLQNIVSKLKDHNLILRLNTICNNT